VVPDEEPVRHPSTAPITEMTLLSSRLTHRTIVVATIAEELDGSVRVRNPDGTSLRIKERSPGRYQVTDDDGNTYSVRKNALGKFEMEDDTSYSTIQSRSSRFRTTAAKSNDDVKIEKEADGTILVYPTLKGTSFRDYSKPGVRVGTDAYGNRMAYPTLPGTSIRDYFKQGTKLEDE